MIDYYKKYLKYKKKYLQAKTNIFTGGAECVEVNQSIIKYTTGDDDMLLKMNAWDCCKDAFNSTTTVNNGEYFNTLLDTLFKKPSESSWSKNWHTHLNSIFSDISKNKDVTQIEAIFERGGITEDKVPELIFVNESGRGGKKVAAYEDDCIQLDTGAQHIDEGPGQGDSDFKFPKNKESVIFSGEFFEKYGFPFIKSWKCTGMEGGDYTYEIIDTIEGEPEKSVTNKDTLSVNNPDKNSTINSKSVSDYICMQKIVYKALGDAMQNALLWKFLNDNNMEYVTEMLGTKIVKLGDKASQKLTKLKDELKKNNEDSKKTLVSNTIMLTCDKTVYYRSIIIGTPCILTGSTINDTDTKLKTGLIYRPNTDPLSRLISNVDMQLEFVTRNNNKLLELLKISIDPKDPNLSYYQIKRGRCRETFIHKMPDFTEIFTYIENLNSEAKRIHKNITQLLKETILNEAEQGYIQNMINTNFKEFCCPPFIIKKQQLEQKTKYIIFLPTISPTSEPLINIIRDLIPEIMEEPIMLGGSVDFMRGMKAVPDIEYSGSEKFLIVYINQYIQNYFNKDTDLDILLHIIYTLCIDALYIHKDIPIEVDGKSIQIYEDEYAIERLLRAIKYVFMNLNASYKDNIFEFKCVNEDFINNVDNIFNSIKEYIDLSFIQNDDVISFMDESPPGTPRSESLRATPISMNNAYNSDSDIPMSDDESDDESDDKSDDESYINKLLGIKKVIRKPIHKNNK